MADYVGAEINDVLLNVQSLIVRCNNLRDYIKGEAAYDAQAAVLALSISDDVALLDKQA